MFAAPRATLGRMEIAQHRPWTAEEFLSWADAQDGRFEFDGIRPVAMTGGTVNHAIIMRNLHRSLDAGLRGSKCSPFGPDAGVGTIGSKIRYPDALITCAKQAGTAKTVASAVIVFEIVSPGSAGTDRIIKVQEYAAVSFILRYVMVESTSPGLLHLYRQSGEDPWRAEALTMNDTFRLPEIRMEMSIAELYDGVDLNDAPGAGSETQG